MKYSQKFTLNPAFESEKFDNEILLYAVAGSSGVYLNETAHVVWQMCGEEKSIEEIITFLEGAYPLQKGVIRRDVVAAVEALLETGALISGND